MLFFAAGGSQRGMRVANYDIDDPSHGGNGQNQGHIARPHRAPAGQRVATISQNYNEKTMLLSSDDELQ